MEVYGNFDFVEILLVPGYNLSLTNPKSLGVNVRVAYLEL